MFHGKEYVYEVYKEKSFSRAAQNLSISQSSITEAIKELESDLGVELFERHPRGLTTTHNGHQFLRHATHHLNIKTSIGFGSLLEILKGRIVRVGTYPQHLFRVKLLMRRRSRLRLVSATARNGKQANYC